MTRSSSVSTGNIGHQSSKPPFSGMTVIVMTMLMCPGTLGWSFITHIFMVPLPARTATGGTWESLPFTSAVLHLLFAVYLPGPRRCQQRLGQTTRKCSRPPCQARPAIRFGDSLPTAAGVACHILPYSTGSGGPSCHSAGRPCGMQHDGVLKQR